LFNALTGAGAFVADQLFATLDPTVRRLRLSSPSRGVAGSDVVLSDTVGFVRDLPHDLVAAFRSTLSEARDADLLLHVVDAADPLREERIAQVDAVLAEIGAHDIPQLLVFNKIDLVDGAQARSDAVAGTAPDRVWVSARKGEGLDLLVDELASRVGTRRIHRTVRLPSRAGRLRARLFAAGAVVSEAAGDDGWEIELDLPASLAEQLCAGSDPGVESLRGQLLPPS
jgi:GTP-binding protein HflX